MKSGRNDNFIIVVATWQELVVLMCDATISSTTYEFQFQHKIWLPQLNFHFLIWFCCFCFSLVLCLIYLIFRLILLISNYFFMLSFGHQNIIMTSKLLRVIFEFFVVLGVRYYLKPQQVRLLDGADYLFWVNLWFPKFWVPCINYR